MFLDWKRSSGWVESWEGLLLVTDISTTCAEAIFRLCQFCLFRHSFIYLCIPFCTVVHHPNSLVPISIMIVTGSSVSLGNDNNNNIIVNLFWVLLTDFTVFRDIVLQCLDDKDESIRLRALDLIVGMVIIDLSYLLYFCQNLSQVKKSRMLIQAMYLFIYFFQGFQKEYNGYH